MIKYDVKGDKNGKLIVFITGAGVGAWMYKHQHKYFDDCKTIFFDLPGHGNNNNIDFTTLEDASKMIEAIIIRESSNSKAIVVGHSIGAQLIMHMIKSNNKCIEKAVIISGLNKKMKWVNWMIKPMVASSMPLVKYRWFAKAQAKELKLPDDMFENYYQDSLMISKKTLRNIMAENTNFEMKNIDGYEGDTLILVGDNEKNIMLKSAVATHHAIPNSKAYIIKNAAHGIPYEQTVLLNQMIKAFVDNDELPNCGVVAL